MQSLPLRRPVTAQVGLRGAAVGPAPPVECAIDSVGAEVTARGDELHVQGIFLGAHHFAEVRRLAGADKRFQAGLLAAAEDFDLEVAAAGGAPGIVCRPAGCAHARVVRQNREPIPGVHRVPGPEVAMIHEPEPAPAELPGLRRPRGTSRRPAFESMRQARGPISRLLQEPAGHVQRRLYHQAPVQVVQAAEIHELRVTQEPGRLVIEGVVAFVQVPDPQGDRQGSALGAQALAGWGWSQSGIRNG